MILLDTNVLSELTRERPERAVVDFVRLHRDDLLYISVVSVTEIADGIDRLPEGHRRAKLQRWFHDTVAHFGARCLSVDAEIARLAGELSAAGHRAGRDPRLADAWIAATASRNGLAVATRNVKHFEPFGVRVINPWITET